MSVFTGGGRGGSRCTRGIGCALHRRPAPKFGMAFVYPVTALRVGSKAVVVAILADLIPHIRGLIEHRFEYWCIDLLYSSPRYWAVIATLCTFKSFAIVLFSCGEADHAPE